MFKRWREKRERKDELDSIHETAMSVAKSAYLACNGEMQMSVGTTGPFEYVSAAGPGRVAWDAYFDTMRQYGEKPMSYDAFKRARARAKW